MGVSTGDIGFNKDFNVPTTDSNCFYDTWWTRKLKQKNCW